MVHGLKIVVKMIQAYDLVEFPLVPSGTQPSRTWSVTCFTNWTLEIFLCPLHDLFLRTCIPENASEIQRRKVGEVTMQPQHFLTLFCRKRVVPVLRALVEDLLLLPAHSGQVMVLQMLGVFIHIVIIESGSRASWIHSLVKFLTLWDDWHQTPNSWKCRHVCRRFVSITLMKLFQSCFPCYHVSL